MSSDHGEPDVPPSSLLPFIPLTLRSESDLVFLPFRLGLPLSRSPILLSSLIRILITVLCSTGFGGDRERASAEGQKGGKSSGGDDE